MHSIAGVVAEGAWMAVAEEDNSAVYPNSASLDDLNDLTTWDDMRAGT